VIYLDLTAREQWFFQAYAESPAMFRRTDGDIAAKIFLGSSSFMRTPKTNCDMKSVDLACNRLETQSEPRGCVA
jgi:hypothetical protein